MKFKPIQNEHILEAIERDLEGFDKDHLTRTKLLLQSDLWSVKRSLDDCRNDPELLAGRDRLTKAMEKIDRRLEEIK